MKLHQERLEIRTAPKSLQDISAQLRAAAAASGVETGLCTVFVHHTSASLIIQENADPAVLRDLESWMSQMVPESRRWEHDDEGPDDMPAHVRAAITKTTETIPICDGRLALGTWQGVYLWEHRARPHARRLTVTVTGA